MEYDAAKPGFIVGSIASMASAFTVGYVTWLIRGGQVLVSVLAHMPAWRLIDPLPILTNLDDDEDDSEEESLASMLDDAETQNTDDPAPHTEDSSPASGTTQQNS